MNNLEVELEELRPQLEVIVLSVKLLGSAAIMGETLAGAHGRIALGLSAQGQAIERRLDHARAALEFWKK